MHASSASKSQPWKACWPPVEAVSAQAELTPEEMDLQRSYGTHASNTKGKIFAIDSKSQPWKASWPPVEVNSAQADLTPAELDIQRSYGTHASNTKGKIFAIDNKPTFGAGVSGLATYLQLRKVLPNFETHEVSIYDSHQPQESAISRTAASKDLTDSTAVVGNSIGLTPHSVRLLKYIDEDLYQLFKSRGYVSKSYTFRTARGHTLAVLSSGDGGSPEEYTISCPRHELWRCLYETVGEDNVRHGEVVDVELEKDRSVVRFADGMSKIADLVIGADGVRSVVKRAIFGEEGEKRYAPVYEGICGVGAFVNRDLPALVTADRSMVFTFGPSGSFGYCSAAPQEKQLVGWWSNWRLADIPESNSVDPEDVRKQLLDRHGSWKDPVIQEIIAAMSTDRVYPLWTTPELPYWGKDRALILVDKVLLKH
ncbi:hypothetical protein N0V95_002229 [Ascochyta clinopodiicola]|nr:hypothetical protein N0V95_002229 [Ascochyta clinopodiicola]